jgi:hypothetical protein
MPQKIYLDDNGEPISAFANVQGGSSSSAGKVYLDDNGEPITMKPAAKPEKTLGGFAGNVVNSGGRFLKDTAEGALGLGKTLVNLHQDTMVNPLSPEAQGRREGALRIAKNAPQIASAAGEALGNRYGGVEQIKDTLYNDPVGVLSDISTVAMPAKAGLKAGGFSKLANVAGKVERVTNPLNALTTPAVSMANRAGPKMQGLAESAYERMLKINKSTAEGMPQFGKTLEERSANAAKALLNDPHGQISKRGGRRFADETSGMLKKVDDIVDANPEARGSSQHLSDALGARRGTFQNQWAPGSDTAAYDAAAKEVLNNPRITKIKRGLVKHTTQDDLGRFDTKTTTDKVGREPIARIRAKTARDLTQGTYRNLGDKAYGELKGAQTEAHKAAARGGREILNEALPEVAPLNKEISKRIDLGQVLDEAVLRSGKHDPVGLTQQVAMGGLNPGMVMGALISRPGIGSPVARGMNRAGKSLSGVKSPYQMMQAALLARLAGLQE